MRAFTVYAIPPGKGRVSWRLQARPAGGGKSVWRRVDTRDEAEARRMAAAWQREIDADGELVELGSDPTVADVLRRRILEGFDRPGTERTYQVALRRLERVALGQVRASALDRAHVVLAQDELQALANEVIPGQLLARSSVNLTLSRVKSAWSWAHERALVKAPWPPVRRLKARRTSKRPYSDAEVARVIDWTRENRPDWLPFLQVLADAGCRPGELAAIDGRDVDRLRCRITLRHTKTRVVRTVAIPREAMTLVPEAAPDAPVFMGHRGRLTTMGAYYRLQVALRGVGLDQEDLDVASFRRAWVSTAHRAGIPMDVARRQTGHESAAIHAGYMANAEGDDLGAVVERVAMERQKIGAGRQKLNPQEQAAEPSCADTSDSRRSPCDGPKGGGGKRLRRGRQKAGRRPMSGGVLVRLRDLLPRDPHSQRLSRWACEDPQAMAALVSSLDRVLAVREALEEQGYASSSRPASSSSSRTRAGG